MSIANIVISVHSAEDGFNNVVKVYKQVKAIQGSNKNSSKFFGSTGWHNSSANGHFIHFEYIKANVDVFSKTIYCYVRSYLHLLQLF